MPSVNRSSCGNSLFSFFLCLVLPGCRRRLELSCKTLMASQHCTLLPWWWKEEGAAADQLSKGLQAFSCALQRAREAKSSLPLAHCSGLAPGLMALSSWTVQRRGWVSCSRSANLKGSCSCGCQGTLDDWEKTHLRPWML